MDDLYKHTFIVIGEEHYTPLGVIRSLGEYGIKPVAMILKSDRGRIASVSKYINKLYRINTYEETLSLLKKYKNLNVKPIVIPCDDIIVGLLDNQYNELKDYFIVSNAGVQGRISYFEQKKVLCDLAFISGLRVAKTWPVKRGEIPDDIEYPVITKPGSSYEGWKQDYYICKSREELILAFEKIKGKDLLLQQYIQKINELCLDGIAINNGKDIMIAISSNYTYILPDYYSMEMIISNFENEYIRSSVNHMLEKIGYNGIFSIEFLIDNDNKLWFLEINFRNSTWSYASTKLGMNLPILWAQGMLVGKIPSDSLKRIPSGYKAMAEVPDFEQRVRKHKMLSFQEWLQEVKSCDCLFFYSSRDLKPFLYVWGGKLINRIKTFIERRKNVQK